jgi:hypothetical protein
MVLIKIKITKKCIQNYFLENLFVINSWIGNYYIFYKVLNLSNSPLLQYFFINLKAIKK